MPDTTTVTSSTPGSRTIVGLMGFTILFSLIGHEISQAKGTPKSVTPVAPDAPGKKGGGSITGGPNVVTAVSTAGRIVVGGTFATALLVALSHAGNPGREWAVGLSVVAVLTATLVYGGPVWSGASNLFGSKPTGGSAPTPTGTNTAQSVGLIATNVA
jgi:hypothetical protein